MHVRIRVDAKDEPATRALGGETIRLGRNPDCELAVDPARFPKVSGFHARIEPAADGFALVHLSRNNATLLNDAPVEQAAPVKAGDRIRLGYTGPEITILEIGASGGSDGDGAKMDFAQTARADARHMALLRGSAGTQRFALDGSGLIGREAGSARYPLDHPHVSRRHASVALHDGRVVLADLGSANGTFLNGRRLVRPAELKPGDRIDIGPFSLQFDGKALVSRSRSNNVELAAHGVKRVVQDRATGRPLTLLDDINLVIRPREFVCLLGPSGSGKSTLLAILSGRNPPDAGTVTVNGEDLFARFEALKEDIAVVPQKDVLHDSLSVGAALGYTAELRLPPDLSRAEVASTVTDILGVVGLTQRRGTLIRHLSGGQVKRASLANELVARPSLLFLDEVTSGLDEQTDREVIELFREVADGGKTVVCITHSLANVEACCHLVVILTEGGRLAFFGTPEEARDYFQVARLGDVYRKLAEAKPESWQARFRASPLFARYIAGRMTGPAGDVAREAAPAPPRRRSRGVRQAWILTRRYLSIWKGDRQALAAMLGQSLLVALVFGRLDDLANPLERIPRTINLLFLLAVSAFWFGCNTAAKELVKERVIFQRERAFNLRVGGYFVSKLAVLATISVAQVSLLCGIVLGWCAPPGPALSHWLVLTALATAGTAVGLLISTVARSEEVATALVPIAVIPQIILAGVIVPLSGLARTLAGWSISVYWGQKALERLLPEADLAQIGRATEAWSGPLVIVWTHAVAVCIAALLVLARGKAR